MGKATPELTFAWERDLTSNQMFYSLVYADGSAQRLPPYECIMSSIPFFPPELLGVQSLLYNAVAFPQDISISKKEILRFINDNTPVYTPSEKQLHVLQHINALASYDGEPIDLDISSSIVATEVWRKWYFKNTAEFLFYLDSMIDKGWLSADKHMEGYSRLRLTVSGLNELVASEKTKRSKQCFIAMSFGDSLKPIFTDAIKPALIKTGFTPIIMYQEKVDTRITINDAIIAAIKKSCFTIADFTEQKGGVYFEAGYALGLGQTVIYTCRKDDLTNAHFDIRNHQLLVWETSEDLLKQLIDRIEAFIL